MAVTTFIYALSDPETGAVRYVGKSNDPILRLRRHIKNARDGHQFHCPTWIRSVLDRGLRPALTILEECYTDIWKAREIFWINTYKANGCDLTNCKSGGDGLEITEETRQRMRQSRLGKAPYNKGVKTSDEIRARLSVAAKERVARDPEAAKQRMANALTVHVQTRTGKPGRKKTQDEIEKISQSLIGNTRSKGRAISEEHRKRISTANLGKACSNETRRKIGDANRQRAAERNARKIKYPNTGSD